MMAHQSRGVKRPRGSISSAPLSEQSAAHTAAAPSIMSAVARCVSDHRAAGPSMLGGNGNQHHQHESMTDDEEVQPLSKRINRLNIDHAAAAVAASANKATDRPPSQNSLQSQAHCDDPKDFTQVYPYAPNSPYYQSNQLLRDLYFQRELRVHGVQQQRQRLYATSISVDSGGLGQTSPSHHTFQQQQQ